MNRSEVFLFVFSFYRGEISWIQFLSNDSFWIERENNLSYSSLSNILQHLSIHVSKSTKLQNNIFIYPNTMLTYNDRIIKVFQSLYQMIISDSITCLLNAWKYIIYFFNYLIKESKIERDMGWNFTGHRLRPFLLSRCLSYTKQHYFT